MKFRKSLYSLQQLLEIVFFEKIKKILHLKFEVFVTKLHILVSDWIWLTTFYQLSDRSHQSIEELFSISLTDILILHPTVLLANEDWEAHRPTRYNLSLRESIEMLVCKQKKAINFLNWRHHGRSWSTFEWISGQSPDDCYHLVTMFLASRNNLDRQSNAQFQ